MKLYELNHKIETMIHDAGARDEARAARDTRLGIMGVNAGMTPTEDQVAIVHDELFPPAAQKELLPPPQGELL